MQVGDRWMPACMHSCRRRRVNYPLALTTPLQRFPRPCIILHGLRFAICMHVQHVSTPLWIRHMLGHIYLMRSRYVKLITDTKSHKKRAWRGVCRADRPIGHRLYVCSSSQQTVHTYIFPCNIRLYYVSTFSSCAISWCPYSNFDSGVYSMLNYVNCVITCFNFVLNSNIFYNHSFSGRWYDRW